jgi:hypothetical protein
MSLERRLLDEVAEVEELFTAAEARLFAARATATHMRLTGDTQPASVLDEVAMGLTNLKQRLDVMRAVRRWRRQQQAGYRRDDSNRGRR